MGKAVLFYLGPTTGLSARQLTITRHYRAGDDAAPAAAYDSDVGAVETAEVNLADNTIWQAQLVDTRTSGETSDTQVLSFQTGSLQFPGPVAQDNSLFRILAMEDLSSSSSSSSVSSSSSESSSSSSNSSSQTA